MKRNNYIKHCWGVFLTFILLIGCTDLDVDVKSEYTDENFPKTEEDFIAIAGGIYSEMKHELQMMWFLQENSTDSQILPAIGGGWLDGGRYRMLHMHTWTSDHQFIERVWNKLFAGISQCNSVLKTYERAEESDAKVRAIAEAKVMRAYFYFMLMDLYGGVPIVTEFGQAAGKQASRKEVYDFVETELLKNVNDLSEKSDQSTYGRPNKWTAYAILAKMSLNAQIYINESKGNETVKYCDSIIAEAGNGTFELTSNYLSIFDTENGPQIKELIFAIPYDGWQDTKNDYALYFTRYWLPSPFEAAFGIAKASGPMRAQAVFYDLFNDEDDARNRQWLTGPQVGIDGSPMILKIKVKDLDADFEWPNQEKDTLWQLEFTKEVTIPDLEKWDAGSDWLSRCEGYRTNKFYPNVNNSVPSRRQDNDFPIFRYADILMMKAEAILFQGAAGSTQDAVDLVDQVRRRAGATEYETVDKLTKDEFLAERGREFAFEMWRRNDLIRFGKFEDSWTFKTDSDPNKRIFPIPAEARQLNPDLEQNPGY